MDRTTQRNSATKRQEHQETLEPVDHERGHSIEKDKTRDLYFIEQNSDEVSIRLHTQVPARLGVLGDLVANLPLSS